MPTIGALARQYGLSRSTLLYYDKIGVFSPSGRSENGYRHYTKSDEDRLRKIVEYRKTGASLQDIRLMLDGGKGNLKAVLERRLIDLNGEIDGLRGQQRFILGLLKSKKVTSRVGVMNKALWVRLLKASGYTHEDMHRWHAAFERSSPDGHQRFLEFLCIPEGEIRKLRRLSMKAGAGHGGRRKHGRERGAWAP